MSHQLSFEVSHTHGQPLGRKENLPFSIKKPTLGKGEIHVQVIPPQGEIVWTTGKYISPR
ncbi:MAG: hypothetical protein RJB24_559 [Candidatus Parcubacteria bacterium]